MDATMYFLVAVWLVAMIVAFSIVRSGRKADDALDGNETPAMKMARLSPRTRS